MSACQNIGRDSLFEPAHRPPPLLEVPMVPLDPIVEVARAPMFDIGQDLA
jgi:hypothetical protein